MRRIAAAAALAAVTIVGAAGAAEAEPLRAEAAGPQPNADVRHTDAWDRMATPTVSTWPWD